MVIFHGYVSLPEGNVYRDKKVKNTIDTASDKQIECNKIMAINYEMLFFSLIFKPTQMISTFRRFGDLFRSVFPQNVHLVVNTPISWVSVTLPILMFPLQKSQTPQKKYVLPLMSFLETSHEHSKPQYIPCHPQVSPRGCEECQHQGSEAWIVEQIQTWPAIFFPTMDSILSEMDWSGAPTN